MSSPLISAPLSDISFTSYNKSAFKKNLPFHYRSVIGYVVHGETEEMSACNWLFENQMNSALIVWFRIQLELT